MVFPVRRSLAHKMLYTDAPQPCNFTLKILENRRKTTIGPFWLNQLLQDGSRPITPIPGAAVSLLCPIPPLPNFGFRSDFKNYRLHMWNCPSLWHFQAIFRANFDINAVSNFHRPIAPPPPAINAVTAWTCPSKNQKPQPSATVKLRLQIAVLAINEEAICFALA